MEVNSAHGDGLPGVGVSCSQRFSLLYTDYILFEGQSATEPDAYETTAFWGVRISENCHEDQTQILLGPRKVALPRKERALIKKGRKEGSNRARQGSKKGAKKGREGKNNFTILLLLTGTAITNTTSKM